MGAGGLVEAHQRPPRGIRSIHDGCWQPPTPTWPGQAVGSTHNYRLVRVFEDTVWRWKFYRDSTTLTTASTLQWAPTTYQMYGETHSRANQMPGGVNSHMHFWDAYYYIGASLVEINSAAGATESGIHGFLKHAGGVHYEIWDKACAN